jgi:hypothetical protein
MPPFSHKPAASPVPADPAEWRPQRFGRKGFRAISNPIVEPAWGGVRVIVRVGRQPDGSPDVTVTDEDGVDSTVEFADLAAAIGAASLADELILDGYLTVEPTQVTTGIETSMVKSPNQGEVMAHMIAGGRLRTPETDRRLDPDRPIAFVAVDLLLIDGSSLIDLPLLERKRLLDGALKVSELVRITPYVRPPIGSLAATWHALGFRQMAYKPANSHYRPTGEPSDWVTVQISHR